MRSFYVTLDLSYDYSSRRQAENKKSEENEWEGRQKWLTGISSNSNYLAGWWNGTGVLLIVLQLYYCGCTRRYSSVCVPSQKSGWLMLLWCVRKGSERRLLTLRSCRSCWPLR